MGTGKPFLYELAPEVCFLDVEFLDSECSSKELITCCRVQCPWIVWCLGFASTDSFFCIAPVLQVLENRNTWLPVSTWSKVLDPFGVVPGVGPYIHGQIRPPSFLASLQ